MLLQIGFSASQDSQAEVRTAHFELNYSSLRVENFLLPGYLNARVDPVPS